MTATALQTRQGNAVQRIDKRYTQRILAETEALVSSGKLQLPPDYSVGNAIASAWLTLQEVKDRAGNSALDVCTPTSVANALRAMAYMGLSPEKKQCFFVVHGNELTLMRSYFGSMMLAKRMDPNIDEIVARIVYSSDTIETDTVGGRMVVTVHKTNPFAEHPVSDAVGAYCNVIYKDGHYTSTIMTMGEIRRSWETGRAQVNSPAHKNTQEEMIRRTVIQRACKPIINTSTDRTILRDVIRENDERNSRAERDELVSENTNVVNLAFEARKKESPAEPEVLEAEIIEAPQGAAEQDAAEQGTEGEQIMIQMAAEFQDADEESEEFFMETEDVPF